MANPFTKGWKYLMALFDNKIEEKADPKVQIEQAIRDAQNQHHELSQQAARIIGNKHQLEMKLSRKIDDVDKLTGQTKQALTLADKARANGDEQAAAEYEQTAEAFATQLTTSEQEIEELKVLHEQSEQQAADAEQAVKRNSAKLEQQAAERTKLLSQLEQTKMQEKVSATVQSMNQITDDSTPTLDGVREKIESRYATALGSAELHETASGNRMAEVEQAGIQMAGHSRLEELRAEMSGELTTGKRDELEQ